MSFTKTQNKFSKGIDDKADDTTVTIDEAGNVGIGTDDPTVSLDVAGAIQASLSYRAFNSVEDVYRNVLRYSEGNVRLETGSNGPAEIAVFTSSAERMRIDAAGQVGIGTDNPARILHVEREGLADLMLRDTSAYSAGSGPAVLFQGKDSGGKTTQFGAIYGVSNGSNSGELSFETRNSGSSAERMRINAAGKVGIGTTSPNSYNSSMNNIVVAGSGDSGITIASGTANEGSIAFADGTSGQDAYRGWINYNHNSNFMRFFTNGAERLRIAADGNVGIGEANPINPLHITSNNNAGSSTLALFQNTGGSVGTEVEVRLCPTPYNDTRWAAIRATNTAAGNATALSFLTNQVSSTPVEAMRIDAYGNLLMNTTNEIQFWTQAYSIGASTGLEIRSGDLIRFLTGNTELMRIANDGRVDITGSLYVNGAPKIGYQELVTTLTTLRQATMDETQDIRVSLRSAIDELVAGFEQQIASMPAPEPETGTMEIDS